MEVKITWRIVLILGSEFLKRMQLSNHTYRTKTHFQGLEEITGKLITLINYYKNIEITNYFKLNRVDERDLS